MPGRESSSRNSALAAILQQRLFEDLGEAKLRRLAGLFVDNYYPAGHVVFRQGEPSTALYLVGEGAVALYHRWRGSRARCFALLGRGEVFGELGLLIRLGRSATAQTTRASRILEAAGEEVLALLEDHPRLISELRILAARRYSLKAMLAFKVRAITSPRGRRSSTSFVAKEWLSIRHR